jgi:hypothetical protein
MSGAIPPLPQYAFIAWCSVKALGQLYLQLFISLWLSPETFGYTLVCGLFCLFESVKLPVILFFHTFSASYLPYSVNDAYFTNYCMKSWTHYVDLLQWPCFGDKYSSFWPPFSVHLTVKDFGMSRPRVSCKTCIYPQYSITFLLLAVFCPHGLCSVQWWFHSCSCSSSKLNKESTNMKLKCEFSKIFKTWKYLLYFEPVSTVVFNLFSPRTPRDTFPLNFVPPKLLVYNSSYT